MALITLRQLLDHAAEHGYGVPAFNINNMEQGLAIMHAAAATDAPVILQASRGARSYAGDIMLRHMVEALAEMLPAIPICLHQDHGNDEATCLSAIRHGFTSRDDGRLARGRHEDAGLLRLQRRHHRAASPRWRTPSAPRSRASSACLGSLETGEGAAEDGSGAEGVLSHDQLLTDPDQAVDFVARTGVDALAIACGTSHGAYKFTRQPDGDILAMHVIEAIHEKLPHTHLVMHGSSSVPQALQDIINAHGGEMPQTWGVPVEEIVRGIRHGVRKVNIDTDCRMAMTGQFRQVATEKPARVRPAQVPEAGDGRARGPLPRALRGLRHRRPRLTRSRPIPMDEMARRYASGALDPRSSPPRPPEPRSKERRRCPTDRQPDRHRQGPLQRRRARVQEDGLLGARLRAEGHRHHRPLPHHAAGRRRPGRGGGGGRGRELDRDLDGGVDRPPDRLREVPRQGLPRRPGAERRRASTSPTSPTTSTSSSRARSPTSPPRSSATSSASSR